jgi:hypothetical protein
VLRRSYTLLEAVSPGAINEYEHDWRPLMGLCGILLYLSRACAAIASLWPTTHLPGLRYQTLSARVQSCEHYVSALVVRREPCATTKHSCAEDMTVHALSMSTAASTIQAESMPEGYIRKRKVLGLEVR